MNIANLEERGQDTINFHGLLSEPVAGNCCITACFQSKKFAKGNDIVAKAPQRVQQEFGEVIVMNKTF